jgi:3',5'-cyclic AMP phosphodiesterase CpdA
MNATHIAHITDLHFGAEDPAIVIALLRELNDDPPDLVVISGDLTQGARIDEFRAVRAFLDKLRAPTLAVPGNHDISPYNLLERFIDPYARWRRMISSETSPTWCNGSVAVLGLNSARRMGLHWDWSRGRVTHRRLMRLLAKLDSLPADLVKVVVMHHPLLPPEGAPQTPVSGGATAALHALEARKVQLVLAGHLHRGFARLASPSGAKPLILQGATATSVRLRGEPNAYNRIILPTNGETIVDVRIWDGRAWTTRAAASGAEQLTFHR